MSKAFFFQLKTKTSTYPFLNKIIFNLLSSLPYKVTTNTNVMKRISTYLVLVFTLTVLCSTAHAQNKIGKVSGVVKSLDKPLEGATISLLKAKDSSLAKAALTNKGGEFEIEKIADGKYLIKVSAVGFANHFSKAFDLGETHPSFTLETVTLAVAQKSLGTVTVATTRPYIEN